MDETSENQLTAALTFRVPQKVGWSVQFGDQSWTGTELGELTERLAQAASKHPLTLSLSLVFELTGNVGTVRLTSGIPLGDAR